MKYEINVEQLLDKISIPLNGEQQTRINHEDCPAGRDTRARLYVKRVEEGYVAHCFNCGGSGIYFPHRDSLKSLSELLKFEATDHHDFVYKVGEIDVAQIKPISNLYIKAWLYKYHLFELDWEALGLREYFGSLYIPIIPNKPEFGCQLRSFSTAAHSKYYTYFAEKPRYYGVTTTFGSGDKLVITEDVISAYRIKRDIGIDAIALLGTSIKDEMVLQECESRKVFVWLDGDFPGRDASIKVHTELLPIVGPRNVAIVSAELSPKQYTPEQLKEVATKQGII